MSIFSASELAALKERSIETYAQDTYSRNIILSHCQREKMGGKTHPLAIRLGGGSVGADFTEAVSQNRSVLRVEANLKEGLLSALGKVTGCGAAASRGQDAIVDLVGDEESNTKQRMAQRLEKF